MIQKKKDKKEHIVSTSLALFTKQGFYNTTTAQIARESGIATGTLFTYFSTKEELIDQIYSDCLNEIVNLSDEAAKSTESCYEQINHLTRQYIEWALLNIEKFFFIDMYNNSSFRKSDLVERFYRYANFIEAFENGREAGVFKNIPTDLAVYFWTKAINGVLEYCINHGDIVNDEYKKMVIDFMMGCISIQ